MPFRLPSPPARYLPYGDRKTLDARRLGDATFRNQHEHACQEPSISANSQASRCPTAPPVKATIGGAHGVSLAIRS